MTIMLTTDLSVSIEPVSIVVTDCRIINNTLILLSEDEEFVLPSYVWPNKLNVLETYSSINTGISISQFKKYINDNCYDCNS